MKNDKITDKKSKNNKEMFSDQYLKQSVKGAKQIFRICISETNKNDTNYNKIT